MTFAPWFHHRPALATLAVLCALCAMAPAFPAATAAAAPADPWPRDVSLPDAALLIYQPQVNSWSGNRLDLRAAVAIKPSGAEGETFGTVFARVRTQVDKVERTVVLEDLEILKSDFPTLPNRGTQYAAELQARLATDLRTISLDRLEASLAAAGVAIPKVAVSNAPPQVIVSYQPAILVPVDGAPVLKPIENHTPYQRVINTRALIVRGGLDERYYIHVYDGWLASASLAGPWSQASPGPRMQGDFDKLAQDLAKAGMVDLLDGGPKADPKPSLAHGVPVIHTAQGPAELVVFKGQPDFVPIVGTRLLWASNTTSDALIDITTNDYYLLLAGRWFRSASLSGPWTFVASDALPADFARIPPGSPAGAVLPSVAGTPQAQEAAIASTIPQTATVPRQDGPTFTPSFDGPPQLEPIAGTSLSYVRNAGEPVIEVSPGNDYAVASGVWFTAAQLAGPWRVATLVPAAVYAIPSSSPLHYVTYVRIYEATPQNVYVGYTPGYLGVVVEPSGTVVYGTGYAYSPWVGTTWFPGPVTYTVAAAPVYNPYVGFTFGFAAGLATAAWSAPYYGGVYGAYYHPAYWGGYPCCATASANVYGHWGNAASSGTRSWYAGGGVAGTSYSGSYVNARTGATGNVDAGRQYNAVTGNATRGYDRTVDTPEGGSANVARAGNDNTYTGQRSTGSSVSGTGAGGSSYQRSGATTAGPEGYAHAGEGSTTNAHTGKTNTWDSATVGNNHYADVNGNVYRNTGDGWQQHSSSGWSGAHGDTSWADRESQARSEGSARSGAFAGGEANRSAADEDHAGGRSYGGRLGGGGGGVRGGRR